MYYDRPGASAGESCRGIAGLRREAGRYMKWVVIIILLAAAAAAGYKLLRKKRLSPIILLLFSAALGVLFYAL